MSLLIKALATAEKDKEKAGKSAKSGGAESLAAEALTLAPLDLAPGATDSQSTDQAAPLTSAAEANVFHDAGLSLAEEAGLVSPEVKVRRETTVKPRPSPAAGVTNSKSKADAFNEAAMASVANLKAQANAKKDNQQAAASVFVANHAVKTASSRTALLLLGVAGALIILLGLQGYKYIQALGASEVVVVTPKPAPPPVAQVAAVASDVGTELASVTDSAPDAMNDTAANVDAGEVVDAPPAQDSGAVVNTAAVNNTVVKPALEKRKPGAKVDTPMSAGEPAAGDASLVAQTMHKPMKADEGAGHESAVAEPKEPLKLLTKAQTAGVDPTLLAAYEAFSRGDDVSAQQKYRQVLQKDVRNVDALLGMAAIAQRQARTMDAIGWYRKVTDIEPRNTIAQSALADLEANTDAVGAESKIKSMLARQPEAANLHAALGNLYAAQNQWAAAQAAYFSASQFAPISADYAFNLAISLEHLGKPKLALVQYQRALDLLNMTGAASPGRAQLEARIRALQ
ncbi:tetratricopeptide repeat protein [Methylotenera mobilis]|uniref:Tetratricopeptide domain protein n=1 Tax=Methylotenera mobilis (strain JLW8 / ATCC BAA-1282 / DSM 17540) TaxID=583345 RepID=C6WSR1_METML|nr:hypothetical protein [Methylotenera mobilis]ACT47153.1 Tetratricopeptide domain protein [Methylotenera mobilis JLW8]